MSNLVTELYSGPTIKL